MKVIDLVCWDFGDTLVDERFMRIAPPDVPAWTQTYDDVLGALGTYDDEWMLGRASMNELIQPLAARLPMSPAHVGRHLRAVWQQIEWFDEVRQHMIELDGRVLQAIVTVNPHEFHGIATACGLDPLVDVMVTSADLATISKVDMSKHARHLLGLGEGLATTLLIDNRRDNTEEFRAAGGHAIHFERSTFGSIAESVLESSRLQFVDTARNTSTTD